MPFVKGHPRFGGRKKGVKPKRKKVREAVDIIIQHQIEPIVEIIKLLPELPVNLRVQAYWRLQRYLEAPPAPPVPSQEPAELVGGYSDEELAVELGLVGKEA